MTEGSSLWCFVTQTFVPGNRNNALLPNLLPDTPYNITVEAIYAEGPGGSLNGNGRTGHQTFGPDQFVLVYNTLLWRHFPG